MRGAGRWRRDAARFTFSSEWTLTVPAAAVAAVLRDVPSCSEWWPQVREVHRLGDGAWELRCRSLLPFELVVRAEVQWPDDSSLHARLTGDLEGVLDVEVVPEGFDRCRVRSRQEVVLRKWGLGPWVAPLRPLLRANHAWMVRRGGRGLARRVAGEEE